MIYVDKIVNTDILFTVFIDNLIFSYGDNLYKSIITKYDF